MERMMTVQLLWVGHLKEEGNERGQKQPGDVWQSQKETMQDGGHGLLYATRKQTDRNGGMMFQPCATTGAKSIKVKVRQNN